MYLFTQSYNTHKRVSEFVIPVLLHNINKQTKIDLQLFIPLQMRADTAKLQYAILLGLDLLFFPQCTYLFT